MRNKQQPRIFDFYPLEDRILLSGEGIDGSELTVDADADVSASLFAEAMADGQVTDDPAVAATLLPPATGEQDTDSNDFADAPTFDPALPLEVVFVDAGVEDAQTLLDGLRGDGEEQTQWLIVELSADEDGVDQITRTLSQLSGVDAIHILSHGDGQGIQLGNTRLDVDTAGGYASEIASWDDSLDADADLLIYGCDLASTADGRTLIDSISALTNADVAASDDSTGNATEPGTETVNESAYVPVLATPSSYDVVLIDSQLDDSEVLIAAASESSHVFVYDGTLESSENVFATVFDWADRENATIQSFSVLSHGSEGAFQFGTSWITAGTLDRTAQNWEQLGSYLDPSANVYILGCDVGGDVSGQLLVDELAELTNADVFASDDVTGQGGDWVLEIASSGAFSKLSSGVSYPLDMELLETAQVSLAWYDTDWGFRREVTIDQTMVSGSSDLNNFAVLVTLTDANLRSTGNGGNVGQTDGGDFVFTSADGTTQLDHQIESYDATTGTLIAWVEVPTLSYNADTESVRLLRKRRCCRSVGHYRYVGRKLRGSLAFRQRLRRQHCQQQRRHQLR